MGRVITNDTNEIRLNIKRVLARMMDWGIYTLISSWILFSVFHLYFIPMDEMLKIVLKNYFYFAYILMILIEPLLLRLFGTTPGKFIFGLYVYTVNENKLTYQEGLSRAGRVFFYGMGLGAPLVNIGCGITSYMKAKKKQTLAWESGSIIVEKRRGWWSYGICILSIILCLFAAVWIEWNGMLPINRGADISKAELIENYDAYIRAHGVVGAPELVIEKKNGEITQVSFEIEKDKAFKNKLTESDYDNVAMSAFWAYVGAQDGINYAKVKRMLDFHGYSVLKYNFQFQYAGITVQAEIKKSGYEEHSAVDLIPLDGKKQTYHLNFVMKKKGDKGQGTGTEQNTSTSLLEKWGLGKNQTKYVSHNRDYDWYIDQSNTGYASSNNCGPSCAVMAAKWDNKDFSKSVEDARDTAPNGGGWWVPSNIYDFLVNNDIPCQLKQDFTEHDALSYLDNGNILIATINTGDISFDFESEERTGKYYNRDTGHFIILKGYMIVDGETYFEVYDPLHSDVKYFDGTEKGRDRYYLSSEVAYSSIFWWPEYIVISEK